jgi:hypothetical protein
VPFLAEATEQLAFCPRFPICPDKRGLKLPESREGIAGENVRQRESGILWEMDTGIGLYDFQAESIVISPFTGKQSQ